MQLSIRFAEKAEYTMLAIALVLSIIVFPILIPAAVSTVGAINDARKRRIRRAANSAMASDALVGS